MHSDGNSAALHSRQNCHQNAIKRLPLRSIPDRIAIRTQLNDTLIESYGVIKET
jgi:hypothetical protein